MKHYIIEVVRTYICSQALVIFCLCFMLPGQNIHAQNGTLILPLRKTTIKLAIDEIQRQSNYTVVANWTELDPNRVVDFPTHDLSIREMLRICLNGTNYSWEVSGREIIISHSKPNNQSYAQDNRDYAPPANQNYNQNSPNYSPSYSPNYSPSPPNYLNYSRNGEYSTMFRQDFSQTRMTFVPDPWSRTQPPFESMIQSRSRYWNADRKGSESVNLAVVNFRVNSTLIERDYMDNARVLDMIHFNMTNRELVNSLDYIVITAGASPEGNTYNNERLAYDRARALKTYFMWKFPYMNRDIIYTFSIGEDWTGLRKMVEDDPYVPNKYEVISIIDHVANSNDKRARLKRLGGGYAWQYITHNMLPKLRGAAAATLHFKEDRYREQVVERERIVERPTRDTVYIVKQQTDTIVKSQVVEAPRVVETPPVEKAKTTTEWEKRPLFAVKTNLLMDALTGINVEVEVPLGKKWSLAGEYVFPWWLIEDDQIAFQMLMGTLEGRYWFGERENQRELTGWFMGPYFGGGYYDLEWKDKGYQGEFYHAGLSSGFAHTISKNGNWRLEYSLGLGYMYTKYRKYVPKLDLDNEWILVKQHSGNTSWIGPTRAKVSLVWMLNSGYRKKGGSK